MASRFEKFSEAARRVLTYAQEEARNLNHSYIGTEHILLGLVREEEGVATRVLNNLNVSLSQVRSAVEFAIGRGERTQVVDLKEQAGERYLLIWIGPAEADAIAVKLQSVDVPRPLSHDLLWSVISSLHASIDSVVINEIRGDTFYGIIILNARGGQVEIDSRPSDALALAVRARAPIFAEDTVLDKAGLLIDEETGQATPQGTPEKKDVSGDELKKLSAYTDFINTLDMHDFDKRSREE